MPPLLDSSSGLLADAPADTAAQRTELSFDATLGKVGRMTSVAVSALQSAEIRRERRRTVAQRRALIRASWWYPVALLLVLASAGYSLLRLDQWAATALLWRTEGTQFAEIGDSRADDGYRDTMTIVAGGLNRKSGTLIAEALMPSIGGPDTRVFSLVYGSGIFGEDVNAKFDALFTQYQPSRLVLVGSSMGGDVVLNIAAHFQQTFADPERYEPGRLVPVLDAIYLDCTPLSTADVRQEARAKADFLTGLTERIGTDGGVATRLTAEMLAQRAQWSTGNYPFLQISGTDFGYKWSEVWREKLNHAGVSTALVKDQYGVIRRFNADRVFSSLSPQTNIVYLRPDIAENDQIIDVQQVEDRFRVLAAAYGFQLTVIDVPGGSHASAARDATSYNPLISADQRRFELTRLALLLG